MFEFHASMNHKTALQFTTFWWCAVISLKQERMYLEVESLNFIQ